MFATCDSTRRRARAVGAMLSLAVASGAPAAAATIAPARVLTYVQSVNVTSADVSTTVNDYVQVSERDNTSSMVVISPSGSTRTVALSTDSNPVPASDIAGQCYHLATSLLPRVVQLTPGTRARGGELDVTSGTTTTAIPVNFAAEALAPQLERVYVYGDANSPVRFTGALDFTRGVVMAATFTVATSPAAFHRCQINLILPKQTSAQGTTTLL